MLSQAAIALAALPYLAVALPFLVGMLVLVQRFYLRTSRQLRLLEYVYLCQQRFNLISMLVPFSKLTNP